MEGYIIKYTDKYIIMKMNYIYEYMDRKYLCTAMYNITNIVFTLNIRKRYKNKYKI
jgi:hypothetical protein